MTNIKSKKVERDGLTNYVMFRFALEIERLIWFAYARPTGYSKGVFWVCSCV